MQQNSRLHCGHKLDILKSNLDVIWNVQYVAIVLCIFRNTEPFPWFSAKILNTHYFIWIIHCLHKLYKSIVLTRFSSFHVVICNSFHFSFPCGVTVALFKTKCLEDNITFQLMAEIHLVLLRRMFELNKITVVQEQHLSAVYEGL